jgi:hypothetical protein
MRPRRKELSIRIALQRARIKVMLEIAFRTVCWESKRNFGECRRIESLRIFEDLNFTEEACSKYIE